MVMAVFFIVVKSVTFSQMITDLFISLKSLFFSALFLIFLQLDDGKQYQYTPPTQPPIHPPYQEACHLRKNNLLSKEDAAPVCPSQNRDEGEPSAESSRPLWLLRISLWKEERPGNWRKLLDSVRSWVLSNRGKGHVLRLVVFQPYGHVFISFTPVFFIHW